MRTHNMTLVTSSMAALLLVVAATPGRALALEADVPENDGAPVHPRSKAREPEPEPEAQNHIELSTGFIAGGRKYGSTSFAFRDGSAAQIAGAGGLVEPLAAYPYSGVPVAGVRWDLRAVISHVRMTVGFGLPRTMYTSTQATGTYEIDGVEHTVTAQSLEPYEFRFGMGGELNIKRVAIFADLFGDMHIVRTTLAVDGLSANYGATTFSFAASAGARVNLNKYFFLSAAGEVGIWGDIVWGAQVTAGFVIDVG